MVKKIKLLFTISTVYVLVYWTHTGPACWRTPEDPRSATDHLASQPERTREAVITNIETQ